MVLIDLEEGVRVTAQLTDVDADEVEIGMPVEMVARRLQERGGGGGVSGLWVQKFRPVLCTAVR